MKQQSDFPIGSGVVYTPYDGARGEDGVVTGHCMDPSMVFVRYAGQHPSAPGQATPLHRLVRV